MSNPEEQRLNSDTTVTPLSVYLAGHGLIETPADADSLFNIMEATAGSSSAVRRVMEAKKSAYREKLNKAIEGVFEIISEAMSVLQTCRELSEDYLSKILDPAVRRGILSKNNGKYIGVDYIEEAVELARIANSHLEKKDRVKPGGKEDAAKKTRTAAAKTLMKTRGNGAKPISATKAVEILERDSARKPVRIVHRSEGRLSEKEAAKARTKIERKKKKRRRPRKRKFKRS